jgi:hypothetical protein
MRAGVAVIPATSTCGYATDALPSQIGSGGMFLQLTIVHLGAGRVAR